MCSESLIVRDTEQHQISGKFFLFLFSCFIFFFLFFSFFLFFFSRRLGLTPYLPQSFKGVSPHIRYLSLNREAVLAEASTPWKGVRSEAFLCIPFQKNRRSKQKRVRQSLSLERDWRQTDETRAGYSVTFVTCS